MQLLLLMYLHVGGEKVFELALFRWQSGISAIRHGHVPPAVFHLSEYRECVHIPMRW